MNFDLSSGLHMQIQTFLIILTIFGIHPYGFVNMLNIMLKVVFQMYSKMPTKPKICILFGSGLPTIRGRGRSIVHKRLKNDFTHVQ